MKNLTDLTVPIRGRQSGHRGPFNQFFFLVFRQTGQQSSAKSKLSIDSAFRQKKTCFKLISRIYNKEFNLSGKSTAMRRVDSTLRNRNPVAISYVDHEFVRCVFDHF